MYRSQRPPAEVDPMGIPYPIIPTCDDNPPSGNINRHHHYHSGQRFRESFDLRALRSSKVQFVPYRDHNGNFHNKVAGLPIRSIPSTRGLIFRDVLFNFAGYVPSHGYDVSEPEARIRHLTPAEREQIRSSLVSENELVSSRDLSIHGKVADFLLATLVYSDLVSPEVVDMVHELALRSRSGSVLDRKVRPLLGRIVAEGCADLQIDYEEVLKSGAVDRHRAPKTLTEVCVQALRNTYQRPGQVEDAFAYMVVRRRLGLESLAANHQEPPHAISKNGAVMLLSGLQTSARGHQVARA